MFSRQGPDAEGRSRFRANATVTLWSVAGIAMGAAFVGPISSAWAAAPANDGIVPTANDLGVRCTAGQASNEICQTDNSAVTYYMDAAGEYELEEADREVVRNAMARWRDGTVLTVAYDSSPTFSGTGETDIIFQEGDFGLPDNVSGLT